MFRRIGFVVMFVSLLAISLNASAGVGTNLVPDGDFNVLPTWASDDRVACGDLYFDAAGGFVMTPKIAIDPNQQYVLTVDIPSGGPPSPNTIVTLHVGDDLGNNFVWDGFQTYYGGKTYTFGPAGTGSDVLLDPSNPAHYKLYIQLRDNWAPVWFNSLSLQQVSPDPPANLVSYRNFNALPTWASFYLVIYS